MSFILFPVCFLCITRASVSTNSTINVYRIETACEVAQGQTMRPVLLNAPAAHAGPALSCGRAVRTSPWSGFGSVDLSQSIPELITASSQDLAGGLSLQSGSSRPARLRDPSSPPEGASPRLPHSEKPVLRAQAKKETRVYFGPLRMPYPGCKQEVELYLGLDVGVKKGQGPGGDAPSLVERTFWWNFCASVARSCSGSRLLPRPWPSTPM